MTDCTVVVLTYKGIHHLKDLLPSLLAAIDFSKQFTIDIHIIDNGSDLETKKFVEGFGSKIKYYASSSNDYLFSLNPFISKLKSDYFMLLNDDMKVTLDIFEQTIPLIVNNPKLFAVNCHLLNWNSDISQNNVRKLKISKGWISSVYSTEFLDNLQYTLYAGGGSAIFNKVLFNKLGGFDTLYRPAYCEDLDISSRAWMMGYEVIFNPKAKIYHKEGATIQSQMHKELINYTILANQIKWMFIVNSSKSFLFQFILRLPYRILINNNKSIFIKALFHVFKERRQIQYRRKKNPWKQNEIILIDEKIRKGIIHE